MCVWFLGVYACCWVTLRLWMFLLHKVCGPLFSFLLCLFEFVIIVCDELAEVRTLQLTVNISSFLHSELMERSKASSLLRPGTDIHHSLTPAGPQVGPSLQTHVTELLTLWTPTFLLIFGISISLHKLPFIYWFWFTSFMVCEATCPYDDKVDFTIFLNISMFPLHVQA